MNAPRVSIDLQSGREAGATEVKRVAVGIAREELERDNIFFEIGLRARIGELRRGQSTSVTTQMNEADALSAPSEAVRVML